MTVRFEESFLKDIRNVKAKPLKLRLGRMIDLVKNAESIMQLKQSKKLKGHHNAFRYRIGEYRIGFFLEGSTVIFSRCLHRKDIYKTFPPK